MELPTAKEIDPYNSLDGQAAAEHFSGKNLAEAEALFRENSPHYQEDLRWMGPVAFRFFAGEVIGIVESRSEKLGEMTGFSRPMGVMLLSLRPITQIASL
jgi:hypothetical protein